MSKPTMSEQEAKAKLEEVTRVIEKQIAKGKTQLATRSGQLKERLTGLDAELAELETQRAALAAYQNHPEGAYHFQRIELLHRGNAHMRQALVIELACAEHNALVLEGGPAASAAEKGENPFKEPGDDPAFLEARASSDMYLAGFHWLGMAPAIDAILRVGVNAMAIACKTAEQEQPCVERANALRAAMAGDDELKIKVNQLAVELQEASLLLEWAKSALKRISAQPPAARKASFEDPDWAKLNHKALLLGGLSEQAKAYPALEALFAPAEAAAEIA